MEKFRSTADPGTGIQPFLPGGHGEPSFQRLFLLAFLGLPLFLLRLPFFILGAYILGTAELMAVFSPFMHLQRAILRAGHLVSCNLLLFSLGVWYVPVTYTRGYSVPKPGDIIVSNHASFVEILFLARDYSPQFTRTLPDGMLLRRSIFGAILDCFLGVNDMEEEARLVRSGGKEGRFLGRRIKRNIVDVCERARVMSGCPVVVFPEGTTSNARGVLKFFSVFKDMPRILVFPVGMAYAEPKSKFSLAMTVLSPITQLGRMFLLPYSVFKVYFAKPLVPEEEDKDDEVRRAITGILKVPLLGVGYSERQKFEEQWKERKVTTDYKRTGITSQSAEKRELYEE